MARLSFDELVTPTLLKRFELEGDAEAGPGQGQYYAIILRENGDLVVHHPTGPQLDPIQQLWAGNLLKMLNRELHHDGAWVIVFTNPKPNAEGLAIYAHPAHREYLRYAIVFVDKDADPQFTVEWLAGDNADFSTFAQVVAAGIESTCQKCEAAWELHQEYMVKLIAPKEGQTFRKAKGEMPSTTRH
jgi:hypothetical protein